MNNKCCCVGEEEHIKKGLSLLNLDTQKLFCQFNVGQTQDLYVYKEKNYCLLHLPLTGKKELNLNCKDINEYLQKLINENFTNFDFISVEWCKLYLNVDNRYNFIGSNLKNFTIEQSGAVEIELDFSGSHIEGSENYFLNLNLYNCDFNKCDINGRIKFNRCNIVNWISFNNSKIACSKFIGIESGILFDDCHKINCFVFTDGVIDSELNFINSDINKLIISNSKFLIPLSLKNFNINNLIVPKKTDYMDPARKFHPAKYKNNIEISLEYQYQRFRDLYNILKARGMRKEMDDYYYLMHYCLEKQKTEDKWLKFTSRLYRYSSDYGQNVGKAFLTILIVFILSFGINYLSNFFSLSFSSSQEVFLFSLKNIVSPFFLFKDNSCKNLDIIQIMGNYRYVFQECSYTNWFLDILSLFESSLLLSAIAIFLITLRWKFKKE